MMNLLNFKKFGSLLDQKWFSYGNIKPDIDFKMKNLDHTITGANNQIKNELEKIKANSLSKEEFSESLGIINHFICDSFCAYHNREDLIEDNFFKHFLYENKIHGKLINKRDFSKYKTFIKKGSSLFIKDLDLIKDLKNCQLEYSEKSIKPARDLRYAIRTSILVNTNLLKIRQEELNTNEKNPNIYLAHRKWA